MTVLANPYYITILCFTHCAVVWQDKQYKYNFSDDEYALQRILANQQVCGLQQAWRDNLGLDRYHVSGWEARIDGAAAYRGLLVWCITDMCES